MALPEAALCDTSVLVRFFRGHDDDQQASADALRLAWRSDGIDLLLLDLAVYEFVNVLTRRFGWNASRAARDVGHLFDLEFELVACDRDLAVATARTSAETELSGYDAAFVAASRINEVPLITADERIIASAPDVAIGLRSLTDP